MTGKLTHFDDTGSAQMVDVSDKDHTARVATAKGRIVMMPETLAMIYSGSAKKCDVLCIARIAGIMAAKKAPDLIPLCHPLPITKVSVDLSVNKTTNSVDIEATVKTAGQTGVEMEALTAVNIAALTVYDMVKAVDKHMQITDVRVVLKDGGKTGLFEAK
jgi:cyclic pyranopterin phosphate synthase